MGVFAIPRGGLRRVSIHRMSVAMLSASIACAAVISTPAIVLAQQAISYSIPAGSLDHALTRFGANSGVQLLYDSAVTQGLRTSGAQGNLTTQEALARLLSGTGLTYQFTGTNTVTITERVAATRDALINADGATMLGVIDVTGGSGTADTPYLTAGSSAHISAEQMERFPLSAPGDLLRSTPGVMATANRAGTKLDVNIRGLQGMNRVGITLDGAMQSLSTYRGYQGAGSRVYVDPELIGGIDITKGPGDGSQAPGSIGGTVAMRTLNADDILLPGNEFGGRLRLSTTDNRIEPVIGFPARTDVPALFEDLNNITGSAAVAMNMNGFELVVAAARRKEGNYFAGNHGKKTYVNGNGTLVDISPPIGKGEEVFNTSQDTKSALAKVKWSNEEHAAELSYVYFDSIYGENLPTALSGGLTVGGVTTFPNYYEGLSNHKRVNTLTASYGWSPIDNDLIDLRARAWGTGMKIYDQYDTAIRMYGGEIKNTSVLDTVYGNVKVNYGISASFEDSEAQPYSISPIPGLVFTSIGTNGERAIASVYSNVGWEPTEWLKLATGISWETFRTRDKTPAALANQSYPDLKGSALNPRASVIIEPWKGIQFFGQYQQGTRPPSLYENTNNPNFALVPNPDLKPEKARNIEVGLNILKDGLLQPSDNFRFKAAYFHNSYDDYLSRIQLTGTNMQIQNIDKALFSGIEVGASYDNRRFFAEGSVNYYNKIEFCYVSGCTTAMQADYATNHIPPKITASLTMGMRLLDEKLVLGGRASYFGKRALLQETNGRYFSVTSEWAPYTLIDAFASYEFNDNLRADLAVDNLFDRYYVDALNNLAQPGPGRTVKFSLTGKF